MIKWTDLKNETKVSLLALIFTALIAGVNEIRNYSYSQEERKNAEIKLHIIEILSGNKSLKKEQVIGKYVVKFKNNLSEQEASQALYEIMRDRLAVYIQDTESYELVSYSSAHK